MAFLGPLHWPVGGADVGVGGVSYVEMVVFCERWAGERLTPEKAHPRYLRPGRPISVSAVPFGPGIDIWRSCRVIGTLMRSLCTLLGGLGSFVPCAIGANHCRLGHIGWDRCGDGLTSRPEESASEAFLNEQLQLFRYPPKSALALLAGTLPLRYCAVRFASKVPTWRLPVSGHAAGLVTAESSVADVAEVGFGGEEVSWVSGSVPGRKRIRQKNLHISLVLLVFNLGHGCGTDCVIWGIQSFPVLIVRGGGAISMTRIMFQFNTGLGWDDSRCKRRPTSPGLHA